jgi:hypothetical protein
MAELACPYVALLVTVCLQRAVAYRCGIASLGWIVAGNLPHQTSNKCISEQIELFRMLNTFINIFATNQQKAVLRYTMADQIFSDSADRPIDLSEIGLRHYLPVVFMAVKDSKPAYT